MRVTVNGETKNYRTVWMEGNTVCMIDQTKLPHIFEIYYSKPWEDTKNAIKTMIVRGAGAIGTAGAYGVVQAIQEIQDKDKLYKAILEIKNVRPTAVALQHAVDRVYQKAEEGYSAAKEEAERIAEEDISDCRQIGVHGLELIKMLGGHVATHCNAGWLAFTDLGSALAPVYLAQEQGIEVFVYVDATGPRFQGAKLTAWELKQQGAPYVLVSDNDATHFQNKEVDVVIVGADRIARNGDVVNKIGTNQRAIIANHYGIPFYVAAPLHTFDLNCTTGEDIPIEERSPDEVLYATGLTDEGKLSRVMIPLKGTPVKNPAFDVTDAELVTGIITPKGIIRACEEDIVKLFN